MRPLLVVTTMMGGSGHTGVETHFSEVLRHAAALGYRTKLITPYTGPRWRRALFRPLKKSRSERGRLLFRAGQSWAVGAQVAELARQSHGPTTVYAQCPMSAQAALGTAEKTAHWRVVLVVHYNHSEASEVVEKGIAASDGPWCRDLERVERMVLPRVDKLAFVSDYMRRAVNGRLPQIARVPQETLMNFAPQPEVRPASKCEGDIIAIGTLEPRKNQAFLLRVLAEARAMGSRYSLALVGEGPDRAKLEKLCAELSLEEQVSFMGFRADAARLIPKYRVLAHAALMENCPITLIEALSYGRPLLAGGVGGIPEIFRNGREGFLWDLRDPAGAAACLTSLLEDERNYAALADGAKQRYQDVFADLPARWVRMLTSDESSAA